jgi:hypothetical protein
MMSGVTVPLRQLRFYLAREQIISVVSSVHWAFPLYTQLLTYRRIALSDAQGQKQAHALQPDGDIIRTI